MGNNAVNFVINVQGNGISAVTQLNTQFVQLKNQADESISLFHRIGDAALKFNSIASSISMLTSKMQEFADANKIQQVAETQLASVMKNTIGASQDEIDKIKELASAQQKLGVIGDEVQLAGAKELGLHVKNADSLKKLMPVMNDYIAKSYGLDASQESAASAGALLGKAMDGNVMMLERAGIKFSDAQKKIMQTGNEQERAATLAEVLNAKVGGMNEALAATPEGQVKQLSNNFGDLKEAIGNMYVKLQAALVPVFQKLIDKFYEVKDFVVEFWPIIAGVAAAIAAYTVVVNAHAIAIKLVAGVTKIWSGVQAVLNAVLNANPIGLVIAGIIALAGVIVFLCIKVKGWSSLWDAVVTFCKESFMAFVDGVNLYYTSMINGLLIGLDKIKEGWYKFKMAIGIGDEKENQNALANIQGEIKARSEAVTSAYNKEKEHIDKARHAFDNVSLSWDRNTKLKDVTRKIKTQLGVVDESSNEENETNIEEDLSNSSTTISSGGKNIKNFNITINDGLVNGVQNYFNSSSDDPNSASEFMWKLSSALQMILNDVNYAGN